MIIIDGGRLDRAKNSLVFKKLSSNSVFFTQAITYAPYTTAALHALASGCYGNRTDTNSYWHSLRFRKNRFKSLIQYLKENGYYTIGDAQSDLILANHGFHEFTVHDERKDDLAERHMKLLELMKAKNDDGISFLLFLSYSNIHIGYVDEVMKVYNNFSEKYFENRKLNEERYDRLFLSAEHYLEKILTQINKLGFNDNSIILVTADHGVSVGEKIGELAYGTFCYDYTIKTFAYLQSKDLSPKEIQMQVRHVDFMPTILDLLEIKLDHSYEKLDGVSLLPLIKRQKFEEKIAYTETANPLNDNAPPKAPNTRSVRTSKWKLIFNEYNNTRELYDLENDPNELNNLASSGLKIEDILYNELTKIQNQIN